MAMLVDNMKTNLKRSSVKVRVLCQEWGGCGGGQLISDWSKMQDGR